MPPRDPDERLLAALRPPVPVPGDDDHADGEHDDGDAGEHRGVDRDHDGDEGGDDDLAAIRRLGAVARDLTDDDRALDEPPAALWAGIAARADDEGNREAQAAPITATDAGAPGAPRTAGPAGALGAARRPGVSRSRAARTGGTRRLLAVAAVVVVVAGLAAAVVARDGDEPSVVARAEVLPLDGAVGAPAAVEVVEEDGGVRRLVGVSGVDLPEPDGFYEVWLLDEDAVGMVSLGPLRDDGTYEVPGGVDLGAFPVVDVSVEPSDGDPRHSGVSVLRGTLS
jgi:hypothetical protein